MRFYYYAAPLPDGQWSLRTSLEAASTTHPNREATLLFARQQARRRWEDEGLPCGVRVLLREGEHVDDVTFGPVTADEGET